MTFHGEIILVITDGTEGAGKLYLKCTKCLLHVFRDEKGKLLLPIEVFNGFCELESQNTSNWPGPYRRRVCVTILVFVKAVFFLIFIVFVLHSFSEQGTALDNNIFSLVIISLLSIVPFWFSKKELYVDDSKKTFENEIQHLNDDKSMSSLWEISKIENISARKIKID